MDSVITLCARGAGTNIFVWNRRLRRRTYRQCWVLIVSQPRLACKQQSQCCNECQESRQRSTLDGELGLHAAGPLVWAHGCLLQLPLLRRRRLHCIRSRAAAAICDGDEQPPMEGRARHAGPHIALRNEASAKFRRPIMCSGRGHSTGSLSCSRSLTLAKKSPQKETSAYTRRSRRLRYAIDQMPHIDRHMRHGRLRGGGVVMRILRHADGAL